MAHSYQLTPRMIQNLENFLRKYHELFSGGRCAGWEQKGTQYIQKNNKEVEFSLRPKMSWQIWWKIPLSKVQVKSLSI